MRQPLADSQTGMLGVSALYVVGTFAGAQWVGPNPEPPDLLMQSD